MKTTKKLAAILLCIAMLLGIGATSTFALEIGDTIKWTGYDWDDTYIYSGTLKEGAQDIEGGDDYDTNALCYEFTVEKDGYYKFTAYSSEIWWVGIAESYSDNSASDTIDNIWYYDDTDYFVERKDYYIFNLSKGTYLVGVDFDTDNNAACELRIDYVAESISDVAYDENELKDLIIGEDVGKKDKIFYFETDYAVTFSNGEKIEFDYEHSNSLKAELDKPWSEGENKLAIVLPGYEKEVTATAYEITHFVKDIEIPNIDDYTVSYEWYNGYDYADFGEDFIEEVVVTYSDGTKKTFAYYHNDSENFYNTNITLLNGREIHLYTGQKTDNATGKRIFYAGIADHRYIEEECEIRKVSFTDNLSQLAENIGKYFTWYINNFSWYIESLQYCDSIEEFFIRIGRLFGSSLFENIGNEISEFINYYL